LAEFVNPFSGTVPERTLSKQELIRAVRLDLAAEEEAIHRYMAQADATDEPLAKLVLTDVANEEREHAGEFQRLLDILTGDEAEWMAHGIAEVDEMAATLAAGSSAEEAAAPRDANGEADGAGEATIGSLRGE
jgi:rubrerythrin